MIRRSASTHWTLCFLVIAICPLSSVLSQSATATLSGTVEDPNGAVIPNASVTVENVATGLRRQTVTNGEGYFTVPLLPPSTYTVRVEGQGFSPAQINNVVLNVSDQKALQIQLKTGNISEMVQINADAPLINESPAVGTVVDRQFVANIPLNGRSFQSLLTLTPGAVAVPVIGGLGISGEFSINGQRTEANYYMVDGVAANTGTFSLVTLSLGAPGPSGSLPAESALGTTQSLVSLDALQEFRIQSSTYAAEYGRTPGGQISFVTRSGTNDWHGSAFDYLRNGALDANSWFNNAARLPKTSERQNDFGGTLGGPVLLPRFGEGGRQPWYDGRNHTFFFFSYEGLRLITPQPAVTTFVPELCLRGVVAQCTGTNRPAPVALQRLLNAYPLPNGPPNGTTRAAQFVTAFSTPGTLDSTSVRIDHNFNANFMVFGRYNESPSETQTRSSFALSNPLNLSNKVRTLTIAATALPSPQVTNEFRFNHTQNNSQTQRFLDTLGGAVPFDLQSVTDFAGNPTLGLDSLQLLLGFGGIPNVLVNKLTNRQRQLNFIDTLSYSFGNHLLKFGADYRRIVTPFSLTRLSEFGAFTSAAQVQQNLAVSVSATAADIPTVAPVYNNLSLFAQDEWKASPRLSVSLGLRWEFNPPPTDAYGYDPFTVDQISDFTTTHVLPRGTALWKTTYDNFAPRLGIVYQLRRDAGRETVVRGGFGVYYDVGNTYASQGYLGLGVNTQVLYANIPYPLTAAQLTLPPPSVAPPYNTAVTGFDPELKLPYTLQWNFGVEQGLGKNQAITLSYVGAAGRRLLWNFSVRPGAIGNPNFRSTGQLFIIKNEGTSDYDAFQAQFRKRLSTGLQVLASYTWSHSIDEASVNSGTTQLQRASSNFDIRHNFQAAVTYDLPGKYSKAFVRGVASNWSLDARISARTALPFDVTAGTFVDATGTTEQLRGNVVPGQPIWIVDALAPGGRRVNFNAFTIPTSAQRAAGQFGDSPRNFLRAFPAWQLDFAVRREIPLYERLRLQFRGEAFNIFNHPVFGAIQNNLTTGALVFGRATGTLNNQLGGLNALYQVGGPRSIQLSLKLVF